MYHLIARSRYGLMVQLLGGLITYLLLAIYCRQQHNEPVSISRVRELRHQIANEVAEPQSQKTRKSGKTNKIRQLSKNAVVQKPNRIRMIIIRIIIRILALE